MLPSQSEPIYIGLMYSKTLQSTDFETKQNTAGCQTIMNVHRFFQEIYCKNVEHITITADLWGLLIMGAPDFGFLF